MMLYRANPKVAPIFLKRRQINAYKYMRLNPIPVTLFLEGVDFCLRVQSILPNPKQLFRVCVSKNVVGPIVERILLWFRK